MKKKVNLMLVITAISYVLAVVIGGFLKENYNHIYNAISELSEVGTKDIFIVDILFGIYNYFLVVHSIIYIFIYRKELDIELIIIYISLLLCGLSGIMMGVFPQEPRNAVVTVKGIMHFVFAGIAAVTTMLATILSFLRYKKTYNKYAVYSLISFIIIFVAGLGNVILMNNGIDSFFGLIERITIGSFIIWLFVTGYYKYKNKTMI